MLDKKIEIKVSVKKIIFELLREILSDKNEYFNFSDNLIT